MESTSRLPAVPASVGYGLIIGLGALFAVGMSVVSFLLSRRMAEIQTSEMFMTAKHSVKTGLVSSAVVSSWTIAATLLSSTTEGYLYGVSGPFWYGAGATVQIFLFAVAAIELKRKAPHAHTFLEVVKTRYGSSAHILLLCYSLFYQIFTSVNLLVGGSTLYSAVTGMSRDAACFLFPIGVIVYTIFGGIKATFITDWVHTVIIYVIMLLFLFVVYVSSDIVGSPRQLYDLLTEAANLHPVAGNEAGSYLTMKSDNGAYIGLIFIGAGFAAAVDSQLFQKAIAADPAATLPGYMLGGLCWFSIPFVLASTFGLAAAGIEHLPSFPTYPNRMSAEEVTAGLAMPFAAVALLGSGGAVGILIMMFMAVTSAMSSETVATAALCTYDIYKSYVNPDADSKRLVRVSHGVIVLFGVGVAAVSVGFNHAGLSVNYLITAIGIFVDSAIVPMACTIMWKKQSLAAVLIAPVVSSCAAIAAWLATAYTHYGEVTIASTSQNLPLVAGNMMSLCGPIVLTPLITYVRPQNFDWEVLKRIKMDAGAVDGRHEDKNGGSPALDSVAERKSEAKLLAARKWATIASVALTLSFLVLWPIPMYGTKYVFTPGFFTGWVVVVFLWAFFASIVITGLPIWEGWPTIVRFFGLTATKEARAEAIEGVLQRGEIEEVDSREKADIVEKRVPEALYRTDLQTLYDFSEDAKKKDRDRDSCCNGYQGIFAEKGLQIPSFDEDAPSEMPLEAFNARGAILDASAEIYDILPDPLALMLKRGSAISRLKPAPMVPDRGQTTFAEIAKQAGVQEQTIQRLLRHAITMRVFCEPHPGRVAHPQASKPLTDPNVAKWLSSGADDFWPAAGFPLANNTDGTVYDVCIVSGKLVQRPGLLRLGKPASLISKGLEATCPSRWPHAFRTSSTNLVGMPEPGGVALWKEQDLCMMDLNMGAAFHAQERTVSDWEGILRNADARFVLQDVIQPKGSALAVVDVRWIGE
ncbi:Sodium:solute symporter family-domain-containing protein [Biscogniauxia sp. FL1348]|nr:Sodium:solute symporter family-domain-containing protein [Biscogniauxia sp. FL1348]